MFINAAIDNSPTLYGYVAAEMAAPAMLAVAFDNDGKLALPAAAAFCIGIVLPNTDAVKAGDGVTIQVRETGYWLTAVEVKPGALLTTDAAGKAVIATAGQAVFAVALEAAAAGTPVKAMICHTVVPA